METGRSDSLTALRRKLSQFGAAVLMALAFAAAPATAARSDFTDLWWNPAEPGWGVNLVQAQTFMFATFFVYGPGNQPVWYTGEMTRNATGAYAGPLYVTTGTPLGGSGCTESVTFSAVLAM